MALVKNLMLAMEQGCDYGEFSLLQYRFSGKYPLDVTTLAGFFEIKLQKAPPRQHTKTPDGKYNPITRKK